MGHNPTHFDDMTRRDHFSRMARLDELTGRLHHGEAATVSRLAEALGVSRRTVTRDIALLRDRGLPIAASIGRGGGVGLDANWSSAYRLVLDHREAIELLLALATAERLGGVTSAATLRAVRSKLAVTFSKRDQVRLAALRRRILVGQPSETPDMGPRAAKPRVADAVFPAFFEQRSVLIRYRDAAGTASRREIEPHYILLIWPCWYVLAWDRLRNDVRSFRLDRIQAATPGDALFKLRNERQFTSIIAGLAVQI